MTLQTAGLLGQTFRRFLYATLHSLFLGKEPDGTRVPRPLPQAPAWFGCFDYVQLNEEELAQLGDDPLALAAGAVVQGCTPVCVTLGARGAAYFTGTPTRTPLVPVEGGAGPRRGPPRLRRRLRAARGGPPRPRPRPPGPPRIGNPVG